MILPISAIDGPDCRAGNDGLLIGGSNGQRWQSLCGPSTSFQRSGAADQKRYTAEYWMACCDPSVHDPAGATPPVVRSRWTYVTLLNMPWP